MPDGIGIVMLQPLLAAKRVTDRRLQSVREFHHFVARIAAAVAAEDRHRFRTVDHLQPVDSGRVGRAKDGRVGSVSRALERSATSDDAMSPGNRDYRRSFFEKGRENRSIDDDRACSGLTSRPM